MNKKEIIKEMLSFICIIIITGVYCGITWIITCGIYKLITMCFGLVFKWHVPTMIWLLVIYIQLKLLLYAKGRGKY